VTIVLLTVTVPVLLPQAADLGFGARREGFETPNRQIRSLVLCVGLVGSRWIWPAHVGCFSIQPDPDRSCRIV
jgi:hypothetical protein